MELDMNHSKKIAIFLLISCGYCKLSFASTAQIASKSTAAPRSAVAGTSTLTAASIAANNALNSGTLGSSNNAITRITSTASASTETSATDTSNIVNISKQSLSQQITQKDNQSKNNDIEAQANRLIQQNYKTDAMKFNILSLMDQNPFMVVNASTASIENLPTIDNILARSYTNRDINKKIIINGLKSTLRAINGALADDAYDNQSIFSSEIEAKLKEMKENVDTRLKQVDPVSYLRLYISTGALAALAATAGVYYYGVTPKSAQDYITELGRNFSNSISQNIGTMVNSTTGAFGSAASSVMTAANSSVNTLVDSARNTVNATIASAGSAITGTKN